MPNQHTPFALIPLSNSNEFAIVDVCHFDKVSKYVWRIGRSGSGHQAVVRTTSRTLGKPTPVTLHHEILGSPEPGLVVDHINRNTLDNRKVNLRFVDAYQNQHNRGPQSGRKFKGTVFDKRRGTWRALLSAFGKKFSVSGFATEEDAARGYDTLAQHNHGEFAYLNFPN